MRRAPKATLSSCAAVAVRKGRGAARRDAGWTGAAARREAGCTGAAARREAALAVWGAVGKARRAVAAAHREVVRRGAAGKGRLSVADPHRAADWARRRTSARMLRVASRVQRAALVVGGGVGGGGRVGGRAAGALGAPPGRRGGAGAGAFRKTTLRSRLPEGRAFRIPMFLPASAPPPDADRWLRGRALSRKLQALSASEPPLA